MGSSDLTRPGQRIRAARAMKGISRPELARLTGIPYATLAGIENGDQDSSTKMHVIARALGVHIAWLETGKGPQFLNQGDPGSQPARLDPETITVATRALAIVLKRRGHTLNLETIEDAALFAAAYDAAASMDDELQLGAVVADLVAEREARRGRTGEQAGGDDRSKAGKKRAAG